MHVDPADKAIIKWAVERGRVFSYDRNHGLVGTHLRLHLGLLTAFFKQGKLVHLSAASDGRHLDQLMQEFAELFGLCTQTKGYLTQGAPAFGSVAVAEGCGAPNPGRPGRTRPDSDSPATD